jgi:hypothetical protein
MSAFEEAPFVLYLIELGRYRSLHVVTKAPDLDPAKRLEVVYRSEDS